jgi:glutamate-5-semialdehyde dehydrogenase
VMSAAKTEVVGLAKAARVAARLLANCTRAQKDDALNLMAQALLDNATEIIAANMLDVQSATAANLDAAIIDRLTLDQVRIQSLADGLIDISKLPDPVGETIREFDVPSGLHITQRRVPFGVVAVIYEARPNVTVDTAGLTLKSGNCALLRGSASAVNTNTKLVEIMRAALSKSDVPADAIQIVSAESHESVAELLQARGLIDVVIPRGGSALIERVVAESIVPVIETGVGNCHVYIDKSADFAKAISIAINSKVQRVSVCNAAETILIHSEIADEFIPELMQAFKAEGVTIHGDDSVAEYAANAGIAFKQAIDSDWSDEYYSLDIAARVVSDIDDALSHIQKWSTGHTEAIVATDEVAISRFTSELDSAVVMVNASTRFTDGGEFGFGAEIGISTQKLHARGPMGLQELTTSTYVVVGDGHTRH